MTKTGKAIPFLVQFTINVPVLLSISRRGEGNVEKYKKAAVKRRMVLDLQPKKDK